METNVGKMDKVLRIALAVVMSVLYFTRTVEGTLGTVLLILGGVFLLTALVGFCPLYALLGINTCPKK